MIIGAFISLLVGGCNDQPTATTTTVRQALNPALPVDINPIPYTMNMLAGMGNVQIMVAGVKGNAYNTDSAPSRELEVQIMFRNGALTPVKINKDSFRVYTSDLNSVTPVNDPFTEIIPSDTRFETTLKFPIGKGLLAVGLVFNSDGYGDRVMSGQFILNPEYKGIETTD